MKLEGKVALVTGGGRAIGRAHALRLARLGAAVVINDVDLESHKEFAEEITAPTVVDEVRALGVPCMGIAADVSKRDEVESMVQKVLAELGHLDILVNNAGGLVGEVTQSYASSVSAVDLMATIDRNLIGTINCCQAVAPSMKAQRWGRIVNTASQAGMRSQRHGVYASYGAAKAGVIAYTKYLAQELGRYQITVNCLAPAYVETARLEKNVYAQNPKIKEQAIKEIPLGRFAQPDDISKIVEFFVTDLGDYVTGQTLSVCGGVINF